MLLIRIALRSKFPSTKFTDYKCFDIKSVRISGGTSACPCTCQDGEHRGTSLIRNTHPPGITTVPCAQGYCRVLLGGGGSYKRGTLGTPAVACTPRQVRVDSGGLHLQILIICKLGFNQNYFTFTLILLMKIVLCNDFP